MNPFIEQLVQRQDSGDDPDTDSTLSGLLVCFCLKVADEDFVAGMKVLEAACV